jgi:hypothetical protein
MPASEIMKDFKAGTLHSGAGGPIVKSEAQAKAIQLSYLRKEGHHIPKPTHRQKYVERYKAKVKHA